MKLLKLAFVIIISPLFIFTNCTTNNSTSETNPQHKMRVLGYFFSHGKWLSNFENIDLTQITDLNIAFINPDSLGSFTQYSHLKTIIEKAHEKQVKVFASIGGGEPPVYLKKFLDPAKRNAFIESLVKLTIDLHFDGIDVDLENNLIDENYASFVKDLHAALKQKNKLITAALATWNNHLIADSTLQLYDFINIMSYDKTGPWNIDKPGQHSPFSMAQEDFYHFRNRNIPAEKLLIGLPFYGYGFGGNAPSSIAYKDIILQYTGAENKDEIDVDGGGKIYYNGQLTIQKKVQFAKENKAGGVMIWELQQDSQGNNSLLKTINTTIKN
jgi:chitinase